MSGAEQFKAAVSERAVQRTGAAGLTGSGARRGRGVHLRIDSDTALARSARENVAAGKIFQAIRCRRMGVDKIMEV